MTKAEKRALEKYPAYKSVFDKYEKQRYAYICGYIQAEKDFLEQEDGHWQKVREKAVEWIKNNLRQSEHDNTKVITNFLNVEEAIKSFNDYIK